MGLQDVPIEIAERIFHYIGCQKDLISLSLSCQNFKAMVEPILYSNFLQTLHSTTPLFLKTLLTKPHLARHLRRVTVTETDHEYCLVTASNQLDEFYLLQEHRDQIGIYLCEYFSNGVGKEHFFEAMNWPAQEIVGRWVGFMSGQFNWSPLTSFLLLLLHNLETLTINLCQTELIGSILSAAGGVQRERTLGTFGFFSKLKEISLDATNAYSEGFPLNRLIPILEIPSLTKFLCNGIAPPDRDLSFNFPFFVQHLELLGCEFSPQKLKPILLNCKVLQILHIGYSSYYAPDAYSRNFPVLISSIYHLQDCLEELAVLDREKIVQLEGSAFPSLALFRKLRVLKIEGMFLDHCAAPDAPPYLFNFSNFPPSLEKLTVQEADWTFTTAHLVGNLHSLDVVPKLKTIHVAYFTMDIPAAAEWKSICRAYRRSGIMLRLSFSGWQAQDEDESEWTVSTTSDGEASDDENLGSEGYGVVL